MTTKDQTIIAGRISSSGAPTSFLFDDLGRQYNATVSAFDTTTDKLSIRLIQGVPTEFVFIFSDFDIQATSISAFKPIFRTEDAQNVSGDFRDIDF